MKKKGQIQNLMPLVTALVAIGITLVVGFLILANIGSNTDVVADANASLATQQVTESMADIPGWLSIIVITVIGALLLGLVSYFRSR